MTGGLSRRSFLRFAASIAGCALVPASVSGSLGGWLGPNPTAAAAPVDDAFWATWARTDKPVSDGLVNRTWMWGPDAFTGVLAERYADSPDGVRQVQYFDKSRMEITNPHGDPNSIWYVTNGLLARELITGKLQVGDDLFESYDPADVVVAGDEVNATGPTYRTFRTLMDYSPFPVGGWITQRVTRDATASDDAALARYQVTVAHLDTVTNHGVAEPFWSFMHQTGTIYANGAFVEGALVEDPLFVTGRPLTEAYWTTVPVAGTLKDVLVQCFERRCLTFTPDNPIGWQVEAGNVGRHYFSWRSSLPEIQPESRIVFYRFVGPCDGTSCNWDIFSVKSDGSDERQLTTNSARDMYATASPDGSTIAFHTNRGSARVWLMDADGANQRPLGDLSETDFVVWSPDSAKVAFTAYSTPPVVDVMSVDDGNRQRLIELPQELANAHLEDWSVDGRLLFTRYAGDQSDIYVIDVDGTGLQRLTNGGGYNTAPTWSPDGRRIAFVSDRDSTDGLTSDVFVMAADGSDKHKITDGSRLVADPAWSPDGRTIALSAGRAVGVIPSSGGPMLWLSDGEMTAGMPSWLISRRD